MDKRPNILWLCTDQQRWDTIHALGNPYIDTPNLDKLCSQGVAFTNAYCQNPICTPSRASFLTGRYPSSINANINGACNLPEHCTLISKRLADAGYECGLIGKLHITSAWDDYEERMDDGYSYFCYNLASGHHLRSPKNPYVKWLAEKGVDWQDIFTTDEKHDYHWYREDAPVELRQTAWLAEKAIDFMRERKDSDKPWLLSVNCYDPHPPYDAPLHLVNKYLDRKLPDPIYSDGDLELNDKLKDFFFQSAAHPVDDKARRNKASYYGMIELIDKHYGRIIDALGELGMRENTLIIYNSDHGEMLGDHGLTHKGCRFYEGLVHIPLIMSMPGSIRQGIQYEGLAEETDIVPTIAQLCGIEAGDTHGRSLVPVLRGEPDEKPRKFVRTEYYDTLELDMCYDGLREPGEAEVGDGVDSSYATMYFDGRYKLCVYHGSEFGELYDLKTDPEERKNLWYEKEYEGVKNALVLDSFGATVKFSRPGQSRRGRY